MEPHAGIWGALQQLTLERRLGFALFQGSRLPGEFSIATDLVITEPLPCVSWEGPLEHKAESVTLMLISPWETPGKPFLLPLGPETSSCTEFS